MSKLKISSLLCSARISLSDFFTHFYFLFQFIDLWRLITYQIYCDYTFNLDFLLHMIVIFMIIILI